MDHQEEYSRDWEDHILTLIILTAYIIAGFLWYGIFIMSWETLMSLTVTLSLLAFYEPLCNILFNVQPTPMDKTLSEADTTDFYEI